jgi:hypothetical protein
MSATNPFFVAKECQRMAGDAKGMDSVAFQKAAVVMMGAMVAATVLGTVLQLRKDLKADKGHDQSRGR